MASFHLSPSSTRAASAETGVQEGVLIDNAKAFVDAFQKGDANVLPEENNVDSRRPPTENVVSCFDLESRFYAVLSKAASSGLA